MSTSFDVSSKPMSRFQITKQYRIVKHFKTALQECADMTRSKFPHLYDANVNKLLKKSQRKIMIFVVRLHYAVHVVNNIESSEKWKMDFATFPELHDVLSELEFDLKMSDKSDTHKSSRNSPATTTEAISTRITAIRMELELCGSTRENMVKELEELRESIDRAQTCVDNFSIDMKLFEAETKASILENIYKEGRRGIESE